MIFESPVPVWLVLVMSFIGLPALMAVAFSVARKLPARSGCLTLAIFLGLVFAVALGLTTYLNQAGDTVVGEVLDKREALAYHLDGTWTREMMADLKYNITDGGAPVTQSLSLLQNRFDEMHQGDFVRLRLAEPFGLFSFVRLEDQSVTSNLWDFVAKQPFFFMLAFGLLLVIAARLIRDFSFPLLFFLAGLVTVGSWWMAAVALPSWDEAMIRISSLNTVSAVVRETHQPYLGSDLRARFTNLLFAPYEVVLLDMTPLTQSQPLLAVDVVDYGSTTARAGQSISVEYSASDPRFAILPDATRSYIWKNGLIATFLALIAMTAVSLLAVWLARNFRDPSEVR